MIEIEQGQSSQPFDWENLTFVYCVLDALNGDEGSGYAQLNLKSQLLEESKWGWVVSFRIEGADALKELICLFTSVVTSRDEEMLLTKKLIEEISLHLLVTFKMKLRINYFNPIIFL